MLTAAAGLLLGFTQALALVWLAAVLGAAIAFALSRHLGQASFQNLGSDRIARLDALVAERGLVVLLALRLVPVVPFTAINYLAGLTRMSWTSYLLGPALGIVPGTVAYVAVGAHGTDLGDLAVLAVVGALIVLSVAGVDTPSVPGPCTTRPCRCGWPLSAAAIPFSWPAGPGQHHPGPRRSGPADLPLDTFAVGAGGKPAARSGQQSDQGMVELSALATAAGYQAEVLVSCLWQLPPAGYRQTAQFGGPAPEASSHEPGDRDAPLLSHRCLLTAAATATTVSSPATRPGHGPNRTAIDMPVAIGTSTRLLVDSRDGSCSITRPSGPMAPDSPLIEDTTTDRPTSAARALVMTHCCSSCAVPRNMALLVWTVTRSTPCLT